MCPIFRKRNCTKLGDNYIYHSDDICRNKDASEPSKRVCHKGYVLCANLTCRKNYNECPLSEEFAFKKNKMFRSNNY